jgi:hypothetical protein
MLRVNDLSKRLEIHTSDRILFKRCRRKWDWSSQMRHGYIPIGGTIPIHFWFGSGFHFAMEDYFGYRRHETLEGALEHYVNEWPMKERPKGWEEAVELMRGMFAHYHRWQASREKFETVWLDGKPLVEVDFHVPLPEEAVGRPNVTYSGTIDRVVRDELGNVWLLDYKTAKQFDTAKLEMDPQVSAYAWAAKLIFDIEVEGMIYFQFKKDFPKEPALLKSGKFSTNKAQKTTYDLFKEALNNLYGINNPKWRKDYPEYEEYLNHLASQETLEGDKFIRFDRVARMGLHLESVQEQILMEAAEMCNPDLPIYPNPTKDCSWDCPFSSACLAKDDGSDYQYILDDKFTTESIEERNSYRDKEDWSIYNNRYKLNGSS